LAKIFLWIIDGTRQRAKSCWSSAPPSRRRPRRRPPPPPPAVHLLRPPTVRFSALPSTSRAVDYGAQDHRSEEPVADSGAQDHGSEEPVADSGAQDHRSEEVVADFWCRKC